MTKTFLIAYDLNKGETSSEYQRLIREIKALGSWAKPLESTWFVACDSTTSGVRDHLKKFIDSNDELMVLDVTDDNWSSYKLSKDVTDWMHSNL